MSTGPSAHPVHPPVPFPVPIPVIIDCELRIANWTFPGIGTGNGARAYPEIRQHRIPLEIRTGNGPWDVPTQWHGPNFRSRQFQTSLRPDTWDLRPDPSVDQSIRPSGPSPVPSLSRSRYSIPWHPHLRTSGHPNPCIHGHACHSAAHYSPSSRCAVASPESNAPWSVPGNHRTVASPANHNRPFTGSASAVYIRLVLPTGT